MKKSQLAQLFLTFFFGPLGLFYSSVAAAIGFTLAAIVFGLMTGGIAVIIIWPICILVGFSMVSKYNGLLKKEDQKHQQILQATRDAAQSNKN